jgi:hypothetical protein
VSVSTQVKLVRKGDLPTQERVLPVNAAAEAMHAATTAKLFSIAVNRRPKKTPCSRDLKKRVKKKKKQNAFSESIP